MRIMTINKTDRVSLAVQVQGDTFPLANSIGFPESMLGLIRMWSELKPLFSDDLTSPVSNDEFSVEAPIANPGKIICIGKNYANHAREMGSEPPTIPVVFSKFNSAITGPNTAVSLPSISDKVDFEAELVVIIGKRGRHIAQADAMSHVFGYCCGNDISARDWQKEKPGGQWLLGKTFDSFAPIGPCIVTADDVPNPHNLSITMKLNGVTMQDSNTSHLIFPIDYLISHISKFVTLEPGDLIFTGTPEGVGAGRKPPVFLKSGDVMEVEIETIGKLINHVA